MNKQKMNRIEERNYYSLDFVPDVNAHRVAIGFVGNVSDDFEKSGIYLSDYDKATELFGNDLKNATVYLDDNFLSLYRNSNINNEVPKYDSSRLTRLDNIVFDLIIAKDGRETTIPVKIIATYYREITTGRRITLIVEKAETINRVEGEISNNGGEPLRKSRRANKSRKAKKSSKKSKKSGKKSRRNSRR